MRSAAVQYQFNTLLIVIYVLHTSLHMLSSQLQIKEVLMLEHVGTFFGGYDYSHTLLGLTLL